MSWRDKARRLLGRGKPLPEAPEDSPEDWRLGDMAECIGEGGAWLALRGFVVVIGSGPKKGEVREVAKISLGANGGQYLGFERYGLENSYNAALFRKVTPKADEAVSASKEWLADLIGAPLRTETAQ